MIVDTSALAAILFDEAGALDLRRAILCEDARLPAPAALEFIRVADLKGEAFATAARMLLEELVRDGLQIIAFELHHAELAFAANRAHGKGMRQGGKLNLLDLMVYALAKARDEPLLCTGKDFAGTDLALHPASRIA